MMFDTPVTIVGNVLTTPEWRRTSITNTLVANFKVASSSRRYDKEREKWVDGPSLRVRVTCWRRLAENVAVSLIVGDPVIATGRMFTRDWIADDGSRRASYELEAFAVGHDLARGRGKFARTRANTVTSTTENAESDARVAGEPSAPAEVATPRLDDYDPLFDEYADTGDSEFGPPSPTTLDADEILREAALNATGQPEPEEGDGEPAGDEPAEEEQRTGRRRRGRAAVPA
jgi:single-strand DNA-binding protein